MTSNGTESMRARLRRRIIVKSVVFLFWAVCMVLVLLQGGNQLASQTYAYMVIAILAAWIVSTIRDVRKLRNDEYLRKAMVAESDERNMQISYKATRLAAVIVACIAPIAICVCAFLEMEQAMNALTGALFAFLAAYLVSWYYISKTC